MESELNLNRKKLLLPRAKPGIYCARQHALSFNTGEYKNNSNYPHFTEWGYKNLQVLSKLPNDTTLSTIVAEQGVGTLPSDFQNILIIYYHFS